MTNTNKLTQASAANARGMPWERAYTGEEKTRQGAQKPAPRGSGELGGAGEGHPAARSGPNRYATRPAAPAQGARGGPRTALATQVVKGEHRKESAKGS